MIKRLVYVIAAAYQSHSTAVALFVLHKPLLEAFILLAIGASLGITVLFFAPDALYFVFKWILQVIRSKNPNQRSLEPSRSIWHDWQTRWNKFRARLSQKVIGSKYPYLAVFLVTAVPLPGFPQIGIIAAKALALRGGIWIILTGNLLNVVLLTTTVYSTGEAFSRFLF